MNYFEEIKIKNFLKVMKNNNESVDEKLEKIVRNINKKELEELLLNEKTLVELFEILLNKSDDNDIWIGRSILFISSLISSLYKVLEYHKIKITVPIIKYYCDLDNIIDLNNYLIQKKINNSNIDNYLNMLPLYNKNPNQITYEQHMYIVMQITHVLDKIIKKYNYEEKNKNYRIQTLNMISNLENF